MSPVGQVYAKQRLFDCRAGEGTGAGPPEATILALPAKARCLDLSADPFPLLQPKAAPAPQAPVAAHFSGAPRERTRLWTPGRESGCPLPAAAAANACKELCHARRPAALRQVSPLVTQLFRVSFLGSQHITRLTSTLRFVINPLARSTATEGHWLTRPSSATVQFPASQKQTLPGMTAARSVWPCFQGNGSHCSRISENHHTQIQELLEVFMLGEPPTGRGKHTHRESKEK